MSLFTQICENKSEICRKFWILWKLFTGVLTLDDLRPRLLYQAAAVAGEKNGWSTERPELKAIERPLRVLWYKVIHSRRDAIDRTRKSSFASLSSIFFFFARTRFLRSLKKIKKIPEIRGFRRYAVRKLQQTAHRDRTMVGREGGRPLAPRFATLRSARAGSARGPGRCLARTGPSRISSNSCWCLVGKLAELWQMFIEFEKCCPNFNEKICQSCSRYIF